MKTQETLINALRNAFPEVSQAELARRAGLSASRFNNYALGVRTMDDDAVIGCAQALGLDAKALLAKHHVEHAATERERAFWRKLGAVATVAAIALFHPVSDLHAESLTSAQPMHYAKFRI